jgi:hypothetical protein
MLSSDVRSAFQQLWRKSEELDDALLVVLSNYFFLSELTVNHIYCYNKPVGDSGCYRRRDRVRYFINISGSSTNKISRVMHNYSKYNLNLSKFSMLMMRWPEEVISALMHWTMHYKEIPILQIRNCILPYKLINLITPLFLFNRSVLREW